MIFDRQSQAAELAQNGGKLYWRVQAMDEGKVRGAAASGAFTLPKGITLKIVGNAYRDKKVRLKVQALDTRGLAVTKAAVRLTGGGLKAKTKKTDKRGRVTFDVKPKSRVKLVFTVTKKGFRAGRGEARVR